MLEYFSMTSTEAFMLALGSLGLGVIMLIRGGNWTIDASVYVARQIGVSPLVVGFTIVAFGTSLPELVVSINANLSGVPEIAIGNVLGSNIANILLVIGCTALFATIVAVPRELVRDLVIMMSCTVFLTGLMLYGTITPLMGGAMLGALIVMTFWQYKKALKGEINIEQVDDPEFVNIKSSAIFLLLGLVFIALGAEFLIRGAQVTASVIGVPEAVIGLSVIAIGTSLPELSTCIIAARKGQPGIILGNIIGSNVFNILMIVGATAAVKTLSTADMAPQLVNMDIWVVLGVSLLFTLILLLYKKINRALGIAFLTAYIAYIVLIFAIYMH